jgi:hypothetical protein
MTTELTARESNGDGPCSLEEPLFSGGITPPGTDSDTHTAQPKDCGLGLRVRGIACGFPKTP